MNSRSKTKQEVYFVHQKYVAINEHYYQLVADRRVLYKTNTFEYFIFPVLVARLMISSTQ
jgi:hypothetical protein